MDLGPLKDDLPRFIAEWPERVTLPPLVRPSKPRCIFICEYCGSASESVEPCKGCLAPRTREQLEALVMMENQ